mgnify:CR=1 FL=1
MRYDLWFIEVNNNAMSYLSQYLRFQSPYCHRRQFHKAGHKVHNTQDLCVLLFRQDKAPPTYLEWYDGVWAEGGGHRCGRKERKNSPRKLLYVSKNYWKVEKSRLQCCPFELPLVFPRGCFVLLISFLLSNKKVKTCIIKKKVKTMHYQTKRFKQSLSNKKV